MRLQTTPPPPGGHRQIDDYIQTEIDEQTDGSGNQSARTTELTRLEPITYMCVFSKGVNIDSINHHHTKPSCTPPPLP